MELIMSLIRLPIGGLSENECIFAYIRLYSCIFLEAEHAVAAAARMFFFCRAV